MAKRLKDYEFRTRSDNRYDWVKWSDGSTWQATKGEDFDCSRQGFTSLLYAQAKRNEVKVRVNLPKDDENAVVFQFYSTNGEV